MLTERVKRWLSEFKMLTEPEWNTYAFTIRQDTELFEELENVFRGDLSPEVIDPVCHQIFDFYRSTSVELQRFVLDLVPTLINTYLTALTNANKRLGSIEACLLGIYNLSSATSDGKPIVSKINIPTLACSSVYHEPPSLTSVVLTESALRRYHGDRPSTIAVGPNPPTGCLNAQNRFPVLTYVMNRYNANIALLSTYSHLTLCRMCSRVAKAGFEYLNDSSSSVSLMYCSSQQFRRSVSFAEQLRTPLDSGFLLELLQSLYFIMFTSETKYAISALEDVHFRASYDLLSDVLMVTNAIRNSLQSGCLQESTDSIMGISLAISPSRTNSIFSKDAITTASFKARKLPEDIEVTDDSVPEDLAAMRERAEGGDAGPTVSAAAEKPKTALQKGIKTPMKSIMKKRDEKQKDKSARKDLELGNKQPTTTHPKETIELHPTRSPRHSTSSVINGEATARIPRVVFESIDGPTATKQGAAVVSADQVVFVCGEDDENEIPTEFESSVFDMESTNGINLVSSSGKHFEQLDNSE